MLQASSGHHGSHGPARLSLQFPSGLNLSATRQIPHCVSDALRWSPFSLHFPSGHNLMSHPQWLMQCSECMQGPNDCIRNSNIEHACQSTQVQEQSTSIDRLINLMFIMPYDHRISTRHSDSRSSRLVLTSYSRSGHTIAHHRRSPNWTHINQGLT